MTHASKALDGEDDDKGFGVEDAERAAAHSHLDRWLDECAREASKLFATGRSGYIGRIKLCAFVDDNGITLRIERSFSEDV